MPCSRTAHAGLKAPFTASDAVKGAFGVADLDRPMRACRTPTVPTGHEIDKAEEALGADALLTGCWQT